MVSIELRHSEDALARRRRLYPSKNTTDISIVPWSFVYIEISHEGNLLSGFSAHHTVNVHWGLRMRFKSIYFTLSHATSMLSVQRRLSALLDASIALLDKNVLRASPDLSMRSIIMQRSWIIQFL